MSYSEGPAWPGGRAPVPADRAARRREARRRTVRRRRATAVGALAALLLGLLAAAAALSSGSSPRPAEVSAAGAAAAVGSAPTAAGLSASADSAAAGAPPAHHTPSPGSLPQTEAHPRTDSVFRARMDDLWKGVVAGSVVPALPAFFPKAAYVQLKAIGSPGSDWTYRLAHDYALDVHAAHALLGAGASRARLLGVRAVREYDHWVPPGVCYNSAGYWETPNARVVYSEGGHVRSFGIASMISWRGQWYVVHLGYVGAETVGGVVDEPSEGAGSSAPSGTC